MSQRSANTDNSRLDVSAYSFWGGRFERAFFDVRVFNPCARSNRQASLQSTYRRHKQEKKQQYEQRIREVEHSTFTPLVLSTTGGMGRAATTFFKRLAAMLSEKRDVPYSKMMGWIRCRPSFALLRASIMSVRGPDLLPRREHSMSPLTSKQPRVSSRIMCEQCTILDYGHLHLFCNSLLFLYPPYMQLSWLYIELIRRLRNNIHRVLCYAVQDLPDFREWLGLVQSVVPALWSVVCESSSYRVVSSINIAYTWIMGSTEECA